MSGSHYERLGVDRSCPHDEVVAQYRRMCKATHPDTQHHLPIDQRQRAEEAFKEVQAAGEVLTDPARRGVYDRELDALEELMALFEAVACGIADDATQRGRNPLPVMDQMLVERHFQIASRLAAAELRLGGLSQFRGRIRSRDGGAHTPFDRRLSDLYESTNRAIREAHDELHQIAYLRHLLQLYEWIAARPRVLPPLNAAALGGVA